MATEPISLWCQPQASPISVFWLNHCENIWMIWWRTSCSFYFSSLWTAAVGVRSIHNNIPSALHTCVTATFLFHGLSTRHNDCVTNQSLDQNNISDHLLPIWPVGSVRSYQTVGPSRLTVKVISNYRTLQGSRAHRWWASHGDSICDEKKTVPWDDYQYSKIYTPSKKTGAAAHSGSPIRGFIETR